MSDTLIDITKEILRSCNQVATVSVFSDQDDTMYIRDRINDGLESVYTWGPTVVDADGTITITPSVRKFNGPSGLDLYRIYDYSWRLHNPTGSGDVKLAFVEKRFIIEAFPQFETAENVQPQYVYFDNGQVGIYPLLKSGLSNLTLEFSYPAQFIKLTTTTATFPFPDRSEEMRYVKAFAKFCYQTFKGLGEAAISLQECSDLKAYLRGKYARDRRIAITGYRAGRKKAHG